MVLYKTVTTGNEDYYTRQLYVYTTPQALEDLIVSLIDDQMYHEAGWYDKNQTGDPWVFISNEGRPEKMFPGPDHRLGLDWKKRCVIRGNECFYYLPRSA
jgi:hypothetical protein